MPSYEEVLQTTSDLVRHRCANAKQPPEIKPTDRIQEDLGLDSLAVMELASDVEGRFGVNIPPEMYDAIHTVAELARAVMDLQARRAG